MAQGRVEPAAAEEWNEARLLRMIDEKIRESASLDYKQSAALARTPKSKGELSKDVSAFANAGGGTLIYGVAENKRQEPERLDDGLDPMVISKEWLDDVISSSIHRKIDGVRIHVVDLTGPRSGRVAYVIEVPQSMRAAHMASDHRYYKRHNFKSEPMEDYEVRDVSRRAEAPDLWVRPILMPYGATADLVPHPSQPQLSQPVALRFVARNRSSAMAQYAMVHIRIDSRLLPFQVTSLTPVEENFNLVEEDGRPVPMRSYFAPIGLPQGSPLWENIDLQLGELRVQVPLDGDSRFVLMWSASAPSMRGRHEFCTLARSEEKLHLTGALWSE